MVSFRLLLEELDGESSTPATPTSQQEQPSPTLSLSHRRLQRFDSAEELEWLQELIRRPPVEVTPINAVVPTMLACESEVELEISKDVAATFVMCLGSPIRPIKDAPSRCSDFLSEAPSANSGPFIWALQRESATAGAVLQHALAKTDYLVSQEGKPTVFKVGVTKDPQHRWFNSRYGYRLDSAGWDKMVVLAKTEDKLAAGLLEAMLIKEFSSRSGCRNNAPGGEGLSPPGPYFVYVVYKRLASPVSLMVSKNTKAA